MSYNANHINHHGTEVDYLINIKKKFLIKIFYQIKLGVKSVTLELF